MKNQKRYLYLIVSTIAMCLYGYGFILTVFTRPLEETFSCTTKESSAVFTVCLVMFSLGVLASGYIYNILKLKLLFLISTAMIVLGILLTAKAPSIEACYLTFGVLYGFGAGIGYKAQLTAMVAWFPGKSGFASGVLFMGTGLTAMIFNMPLNNWIENNGWRNAFLYLGWITLVFLVLNIIIVKPYDKDPFNRSNQSEVGGKPDVCGMKTGQMVTTLRFWSFFAWSTLVSAICMTVASNSVASALSIGISPASAAFFSGLISLFNSISRIGYGIIYDKKGKQFSMAISLLFLVAGVLLILLGLKQKEVLVFIAGFLLMGICLGAVHPISSAYTLQVFGPRYYSENYSVQGLFTLISTFIGPLYIGNLYAKYNSYYDSYLALIPYCILAIVSFGVLSLSIRDKKKVIQNKSA